MPSKQPALFKWCDTEKQTKGREEGGEGEGEEGEGGGRGCGGEGGGRWGWVGG